MVTTPGEPVSYHLPLDLLQVPLNDLIGRQISLTFSGQIHCVACGRKIKKTFSEGHCWNCTQTLASCDFCIMKPETCHYEKGTCREPAWGEAHCFTPHFVYLANSSGLKVGITREVNTPTRWIDQGAHQAMPIFKVQSRLQSGVLEMMFKEHCSDRTDWRKMLRNHYAEIDLVQVRDQLLEKCAPQISEFRQRFGSESIQIVTDPRVLTFVYPVQKWPIKVTSFNLDKNPLVEGVLQGIKGQYLIFDKGVINIRKYTGYLVTLTIDTP